MSARAREALGLPAPEPPEPPPPAPPAPAPEPSPRRYRSPPRRFVLAGLGALVVIAAVVLVVTRGYSGPPIAYDFDGDGAQEIVISGPGLEAVLIGDGDEVKSIATEPSGGAGTLTSGDFDGDGHADLAIGVVSARTLTIVYGAEGGLSDARRQNIRASDFELPSAAGRYGANVLARDFDDDSYADLVIAAPGDETAWETGAVGIVFGSEQGLQTDRTRLLPQPTNGEISAFGSRLRSGDLNSDGDIDLVEGSPDPDEGDTAGHLAWCPGSAEGPTTCTALTGVDEDGGSSALAVADVTGDGRDDIVQSDAELPGGTGGLRLWPGGPGGPAATPEVVTPEQLALDAAALTDRFGAAVDAGPLDDDDYADIVVGVPGLDEEAGAIAIVRGGDRGFATTGHTLRHGDDPGAQLGSTVAMLRRDGPDARPDVVVAAEGAGDLEGAVFVLRGDDLGPLGGLAGIEGSPNALRLGRTPGA